MSAVSSHASFLFRPIEPRSTAAEARDTGSSDTLEMERRQSDRHVTGDRRIGASRSFETDSTIIYMNGWWGRERLDPSVSR